MPLRTPADSSQSVPRPILRRRSGRPQPPAGDAEAALPRVRRSEYRQVPNLLSVQAGGASRHPADSSGQLPPLAVRGILAEIEVEPRGDGTEHRAQILST